MAAETGKRVLVTGGARGVGRAIVRRLAREGYSVDFTVNTSVEDADRLCAELGPTTKALRCDLTDKKAVDRLAEALATDGPYWGLVHNAGITYDNLAVLIDQDRAEALMQVNYWSFVRLVKALARPMTHQRGGRIVAIGSLTAARGSQGNAAYAASKAALQGFITTLTIEVARRGVTVNAVVPGFIDTDMLAPYGDKRAAIEKQIPAGRFAQPEDIAGFIAFLLSPEAGYITGATLAIDGGLGAALAVQR